MASVKPEISYSATDWKDDKTGGTPITAEQLNRIERGVQDAAVGVNAINRLPMTYLVDGGGDVASQDINGTDIAAPCYVYDKRTNTAYFDDGQSHGRIQPFPTTEQALDIREFASQINSGIYKGRDLSKVFADEIAEKENVWDWLQSRVKAENYTGINIGDYIEVSIQQAEQVAAQTVSFAIGAIDPYFNCGDRETGHHIAMVPRSTVEVRGPNAVNGSYLQWRKTNDNNGTSAQRCPYLLSQLHEWENGQFLHALPSEVQSAIMPHRVLLEERYGGGKINEPSGWSWQDVGKIWSLSEVEVYGFNAWSKPGYGSGFDCQFPIFKQTKDRIMGGRIAWWLRSVSGSSSSDVCDVSSHGYAHYISPTYDWVRPRPCFLVG